MTMSFPKSEFIAEFIKIQFSLIHQEDEVDPNAYRTTHKLKALPDPVKVSSAPSPVVVVVSLLFKGSVLTARRDTT